MARQQAIEAVHFVHQGKERPQGERLFPRFHWVSGRDRRANAAQGFQRFVEAEDLPEEHALAQAKISEPITLDELSEVPDEDRPKAFYDHIRNKDYGLSPEIPADKRTLSGLRISEALALR